VSCAPADIECWKELFFGHWESVERMLSRRLANADLAAEAGAYVLDKCAEDDWKRVRTHEGRSSFRTYIHVVAKRLLADFLKSKFPRKTVTCCSLWRA